MKNYFCVLKESILLKVTIVLKKYCELAMQWVLNSIKYIGFQGNGVKIF
jgi:hypothetical protein